MAGPRRILLTRQPEQSAALRAGLESLGVDVVEVPLIEIVPADPGPLDDALGGLAGYDLVLFTSSNSVDAVADRLQARRWSWPAGPALGVVGPATAEAVRRRLAGVPIAVQPTADSSAEGLLAALQLVGVAGRRVLLPQSERARPTLADGLRARGALVDVVIAYGNQRAPAAEARLAAALTEGVDLVLFASPSAVEGFTAAAAVRPPAAVIGPTTEHAARAAGFDVAAIAQPASVEGLLAAVRGWLTAQSR